MMAVERLGQSPVDDERLAVVAEHYVFRLQVSMNDSKRVSRIQAARDLIDDRDRLVERKPACSIIARKASIFGKRRIDSTR